MSTIARSSSFETDPFATSPLDNALVMNPVNQFNITVIGLKRITKNLIIGYTKKAIRSGNDVAIDLGNTSENTMIVTVNITEAIPILNPCWIARVVTRIGSTMLAILFPISMVVINSLGLDTNFNNFSDLFSPLFALVCNLILFVAVNAVSLPEKKNETNSKKMIAMITIVTLLV